MTEDYSDLFQFDDGENVTVEPTETEPTGDLNNPGPDFNDDDYTPYEPEGSDEPDGSQEISFLDQLLKAKGIDRDKIQIYDENNELTEISFDELTDEQKVDLLNSEVDSNPLTDAEIETLNYLRTNNMSLKDFAEWQKQVGIEEYKNSQQVETDIDNFTDEEVIAYDLIQRFGEDMEDEEIDAEIERLKANPEVYQKRVNLLRTAYKNEAEANRKLYEEQEQNQMKANQEAFVNAYNSAITDFNYIQGMKLEKEDKDELLDFILTKDEAGQTKLSKAMNDPENVLKMTWGLLHGEEVAQATKDYFTKEIAKREKATQQPLPKAVNRAVRKSQTAFSI